MYLESLAVILVASGLLTDSSTAQTTADNCFNTEESCYAHRREEICQGIYRGWASVRCARYCGFCTGSGPDLLCKDKINNCNEYRACDTPSYFAWVGQNCRAFCNRCDPDLTVPTNPSGHSTPPRPPTQGAVTSQATSRKPVTTQTLTSSAAQTTAAVTRPPTTPSTTINRPTCKDPLPYCNIYSRGACANMQWAKTYCPNFCNICGYVTGPVTAATARPVAKTTFRPVAAATTKAPAGCQDQLPFCNTYSKDACSTNIVWARNYCRNYCGLCVID